LWWLGTSLGSSCSIRHFDFLFLFEFAKKSWRKKQKRKKEDEKTKEVAGMC
jgi:hypothetical protein